MVILALLRSAIPRISLKHFRLYSAFQSPRCAGLLAVEKERSSNTLFISEDPSNSNCTGMDASSGAAPESQHLRSEELARGKWITLNEITYKDPAGKERKWEAVYRTTKMGDGADAVVMIPILKQEGKKDSVILVKQYRPPLKAYTIEFPAGLIDKGESAYDCALRELKEETGYTGIHKHTSPGVCLDPGLTNSTIHMVTLEIDGTLPENKNPEQQQDEGEFIKVFCIPVDELLSSLNDFAKEGAVVHSILYTYALTRN